MLFETKTIPLKDGRNAILRAPKETEGAEMIIFLKQMSGETEFILRTPEECLETPEQEAEFLSRVNASASNLMIVCEVDGKIAGNCQISFKPRLKVRHRASLAIGILREYWNLGIGTAMFRELIDTARKNGVEQLELEYVDGNERGRALYEKMGFVTVGEKPDAFRLKDGSSHKEISMIKRLDM